MPVIKTVKVDGYTFPANLTGLALAVESDHSNCDSTACDIRAAVMEAECPITAARLLQSATDCHTVDAVMRALAFNREPLGTHLYDCPDWSTWAAWHDAHKITCPSCEAVNYVTDVDYPPEHCGNCLGDLLTDFQGIAADWHGGQSSALYAFASTGTVVEGLAREVTSCVVELDANPDRYTDGNTVRLHALAAHVDTLSEPEASDTFA